jgi:UDP-N-acetyl-D-glucosamine dehydrogenase
MKYKNNLLKKIKNKSAKICVVGLGYVGFPLMDLIKKKGFEVVGIDTDNSKVNALKKKLFSVSNNYSEIKNSDIIIYALPTPLNQNKKPDLRILKKSILISSGYFKKGQLAVIESTSYPGTTRECFKKTASLFDIGKNFFISYSPERIDPGNKNYDVKNIPKIISGFTKSCLKISEKFYSHICNKTILSSSIEIAEFTKIYENIFRYVNIGLSNETKRIAEKLSINFNEVLNLASSKPFGFMKFLPGIGVGGHCIPIDPYYLSWIANKKKIKTEYVKLSGKINRATPKLISYKIIRDIQKKKLKGKILLIGISYKKNISDLRNSPNIEVFNYLRKYFSLDYHDEFVRTLKVDNKNFNSIKLNNYKKIKNYSSVIYLNDHDYLDKKKLLEFSNLIYDCTSTIKENAKVISI